MKVSGQRLQPKKSAIQHFTSLWCHIICTNPHAIISNQKITQDISAPYSPCLIIYASILIFIPSTKCYKYFNTLHTTFFNNAPWKHLHCNFVGWATESSLNHFFQKELFFLSSSLLSLSLFVLLSCLLTYSISNGNR